MARHHQQREQLGARLAFITHLRAIEAESWLAERKSEARFIRTSTYMPQLYERHLLGDTTALPKLLERLSEFIRGGAAAKILLIERTASDGPKIVSSTAADDAPLPPRTREAIETAIQESQTQVTDPDQDILDIVIPYVHSANPNKLLAILRMNPADTLLRHLPEWPLADEAAEIGLWHLDAQGLRALATVNTSDGNTKGLAPSLRPAPDWLTQTLKARPGPAGVPAPLIANANSAATVLGAAQQITGSPWLLTAQVSPSELLHRTTTEALWIALTWSLLASAAWAGSRAYLQRQAQHRQLQQLGLYTAVAEGSADLIFAKDLHSRYVVFTPLAGRRHGRHPDAVLGQTDQQLFPPERAAAVQAQDRSVLETGQVLRFEDQWESDGALREYAVTKGPLRDPSGRIIGLYGVLRDITDQRNSDRAAAKEASLRSALLESAHDGIVVLDTDGAVHLCNLSFAEMIGHDRGDVLTMHVWDWDARWSKEELLAVLALPHVGAQTYESRIRHRDGHLIDVEASASTVDYDGQRLILCSCRDITERQRTAAELKEHRQHLERLVTQRTAALEQALVERQRDATFIQNIIDSVPGAISYWDADRRCRFANRAYAEQLGVSPESLQGRHHSEILAPQTVAASADHVNQAWAGKPQQFERELTWPDGQTRPTWTTFTPHIVDGQVVGVFSAYNDISLLKQAEWRLQQLNQDLVLARDNAEAANRAKSSFLANMSHEIRTPMNAIIGLTHLMQREARTPVLLERLDKVNDAAQHLLAIINNILDLSKIEAGKLELEQIEFSLDTLLSRVTGLVADKIRANGVELVIDTDHLPDSLNGDATRLAQALLNLLNNAAKFTEQGSITLRCSMDSNDEQGLLARFEVIDTGIGIPLDKLNHLFQPFAQADSSTTRRVGGSGLGLTITRRLAELMGGQAGVSSEPGRGSRFWFSARLRRGRRGERPQRIASLHGKRLLLADDLPEARQALGDMLEQLGLQTVTCDSGASAVDAWQADTSQPKGFDFVMLDWKMPGLDGLQTWQRLQQLANARPRPGAPTRALLISACDAPELHQQARLAGFDAVLLKPITASTLLDCLSALDASVAAPVAASPRAGDKVDSEALLRDRHRGAKVLLAEDNPVNREVASELLRAAGLEVDIAVNGTEAVAMASQRRYDLLLMDVQMPEMDGLQATRVIRRLPGHSTGPILAMTASAFAEDRQACLRAGMDDHVVKPVEPQQLYASLLRWLDHSHRRPKAERQPLDTAPGSLVETEVETGAVTADLDADAGLRRIGGNQALYLKVVDQFDALYQPGGSERRDLEQALKQAETSILLQALHSLRGAAGAIGAVRVPELCLAYETMLRDSGPHSAGARYAQDLLQALDTLLQALRD